MPTTAKEDIRALNLALTDEETIGQLSSSGRAAQYKRQKNREEKEAKEKSEAKKQTETEKAQKETGKE